MPLLLFLACRPDPAPSTPTAPTEDPLALVELVDPMIGTGGLGFSVGCAFPGPSRPWGLAKPSPDTANEWGAAPAYHHGGGYHYDDTHIQGFSHLHMHAIGVTDYGSVLVMAVSRAGDAAPLTPEQTLEPGYQAAFSHEDEEARLGYYRVGFASPAMQVELASTRHLALHRYQLGEVASPALLVDLGHALDGGTIRGGEIELDPETGRLWGSARVDGGLSAPFTVWFAGELDTLPSSFGTWSGAAGATRSDASAITVQDGATSAAVPVDDGDGAPHARLGAWLGFPTGTQTVHLRLAVSTVDQDGAWDNLAAQGTTWSIEELEDQARTEWSDLFSALRVWGGAPEDQVKLATALYHSALMPTIFSDADGRYTGFDGQIHQADHLYHTDFSLWDTYRTTHPLYTLLWPDRHRDMLRSFARMVEQGGNLPRWAAATHDSGTMVGTPAVIVWAEAWQKGLRDFDEERLAQVSTEVATGALSPAYGGRPDPTLLDTYGYYPSDLVDRSVAWTQETAISDHALSLALEGMGRAEEAAFPRARAQSYAALYNPDNGWIQARRADGSFEALPDPGQWNEAYAEGNARQYLWLAPHTPEALFAVLGGEATALARLQETMEQTRLEDKDRLEAVPNSWYWHGNEPSLHIPWLFGLAGRPDLGRQWVRWVMNQYYGTDEKGITGNDDAGTVSAWFVFASLGIYPLAGTERYLLGLPAFERIEWGEGEQLVRILSTVDPDDGEAEVRVRLDGEDWEAPDLVHDQLQGGAVLQFEPRP